MVISSAGRWVGGVTMVAVLNLLVLGYQDTQISPEEALFVMADPAYIDASVAFDDLEIGVLSPVPDPQNWIERLEVWLSEQVLKRTFGVDDVFDFVAITVDLDGCPAGLHKVVISKPGFDELRRSFTYPDDLYEGLLFLSFDNTLFGDGLPCGENEGNLNAPEMP